jgi:hypothetical protein
VSDEEPVEITYYRIMGATSLAYRVEVELGCGSRAEVFIPRSQISEHSKQRKTMTIPAWLAVDRGLA